MMTLNVVDPGEVVIVLLELALVERRYQAVLEVLQQGVTVTEVAVRFGVTRQTVHRWLRRYAGQGLSGLADGSERPLSCPHQMPPELAARLAVLPPSGACQIRCPVHLEAILHTSTCAPAHEE